MTLPATRRVSWNTWTRQKTIRFCYCFGNIEAILNQQINENNVLKYSLNIYKILFSPVNLSMVHTDILRLTFVLYNYSRCHVSKFFRRLHWAVCSYCVLNMSKEKEQVGEFTIFQFCDEDDPNKSLQSCEV